MNPRKKPHFIRQLGNEYAKLGDKWRKPRGKHSKLRTEEKGKGRRPKIGYGAPRALRYMHPSGFMEIVVHNVNELKQVDASRQAVKIAHTVGRKLRAEILKKAEELKVKVLNP